jgi:CheY-like chemotaxis protein
MAPTASTVLVVEDEPMVRDLIAEALGGEGYTVVQATDGVEAMRLLDANRPPPTRLCLVLLDMMMPRADGNSVLRYLATLDSYVPVVAMSASRQLLSTAAAAGAQATLPKPFDIDELLGVVARNCGPAGVP